MDPRSYLNNSNSVLSLNKSPPGAFKPSHSRSSSTGSNRPPRHQARNWEVVDDNKVEGGQSLAVGDDMSAPGICEGYLMKKRKYPLKGWHKRYFILDKGVLRYSKTQQDILKGKVHGSLDVSLAVMSINKKSKRIDLDTGDNLYHIKAKSHELFYIWLTKLCAHRGFKKNEAMNAHHLVLQALSTGNSNLPAMANLAQRSRNLQGTYQNSGSMYTTEEGSSTATPGVNSKVSAWLQQTSQADVCTQELARCQLDLAELAQLIQKLHNLEGTNDNLEQRISMQNLTLEKPKKRPGKIWGHTRTLSHTPGMVSNEYISNHLGSSTMLASSVQSIPTHVYSQLSTPTSTSPEGKKIQQDICTVSQRTYKSLKSVHELLKLERERVRLAWVGPDLRQSTSDQLATLCTTLSEMEVKSCLTKVHSLSLSSDSTEDSFCTVLQDQPAPTAARHVQRAPSMAESMAEYFDAREVVVCETSSENEASDESGLSDVTTSNSEPEEGHAAATLSYRASISVAPDLPLVPAEGQRRERLPAHCVDNSHIGIMTILYNNMGKDLSRVSMPAALNEPLCLLQRMSEELEYSELLDMANRTDDPYARMVYMGVFSISGYAWASWRNRYKPFNPLLGETYENDRTDRGFRYVSEQVCHHPPISACHAESKNFSFWQDQRWKNKFWGKSVEIISSGPVNVTLPNYGDHYQWNKVVTCIHNVLSPQRWLEHYGEVTIHNVNSDVCTCKITFVKSRYWGSDSAKNEVQGTVLDRNGKVVHRFGGLWHEGIFCDTMDTCIWKPNVQPADYFNYYGFSQYARELNEITPELEGVLPPTDTRYRPDQRILEEGKVAEADRIKDLIEQRQRERRKEMAKVGEEHVPRFFTKSVDATGQEVWLTNGTYWKLRDEPGFTNMEHLDLWTF